MSMYEATSLGQFGSEVVLAGNNTNIPAAAVQCLSDTVFEFLTATDSTLNQLDAQNNTITVPAGTILYGRFTYVEVQTGTVVCYRSGIN